MWKFKHLFMNTETGAEAPAGNAGRGDGGNGDGTQNPGGGTPAGTSLLSTLWAMTENSTLKAQPANWRMLTRTLKSAWAAGTRRRKLLMSMRQR